MRELLHLIARCPRHAQGGQACGVYDTDRKTSLGERARTRLRGCSTNPRSFILSRTSSSRLRKNLAAWAIVSPWVMEYVRSSTSTSDHGLPDCSAIGSSYKETKRAQDERSPTFG